MEPSILPLFLSLSLLSPLLEFFCNNHAWVALGVTTLSLYAPRTHSLYSFESSWTNSARHRFFSCLSFLRSPFSYLSHAFSSSCSFCNQVHPPPPPRSVFGYSVRRKGDLSSTISPIPYSVFPSSLLYVPSVFHQESPKGRRKGFEGRRRDVGGPSKNCQFLS